MNYTQYGYYFHHADFPDPHTSDRVEIYLGKEDVDWLFPTRQLYIWVIESDRAQHAHFSLHNLRHGTLQVGPGYFELISWRGDTIKGFCFGGSLTLDEQGEITIATLTSPAPIFRLVGDQQDSYGLFGAEIGTLFARAGATLNLDESEIIEGLTKVLPLEVMAFLVHLLHEQFHQFPREIQHSERGEKINRILVRSITYLETHEHWPPRYKSWQEILASSEKSTT